MRDGLKSREVGSRNPNGPSNPNGQCSTAKADLSDLAAPSSDGSAQVGSEKLNAKGRGVEPSNGHEGHSGSQRRILVIKANTPALKETAETLRLFREANKASRSSRVRFAR